jgi:hypothetical protein
VARPITWPAGLMAGLTTGSSVTGSSKPGGGQGGQQAVWHQCSREQHGEEQ